MRALQFAEHGDPSKLALRNLPDPVASPGMALVHVAAASVNPSDVKNVAGVMAGTVLPRVPGRDFSGVVEAGPPDWVGAEVWGTGGEIGFTSDGTHAERIAFPVAGLVRKPKGLSHEATAAIGVNFLVAWLGLVSYASTRGSDVVAVVGAGGGVGSAVIQIARGLGCRVLGVDRGPSPPPPAGALLDAFIDAESDFADEVRRLTGGAGAGVVFDAVGGVLFERSLRSAALRGRVVQISSTGARRVSFDLADFYHNETQLFGADTRKLDAAAAASILAALVPGFESGLYRPPTIAKTYPLEEGVEAYRAVERGTRGRVVLTM